MSGKNGQDSQNQKELLKEKQNIVNKFKKEHILDKKGGIRTHLKEKIYEDNSHYMGEVIDERRTGKGLYVYSNGDVYAGDWKDDKFDGKGIYIFSNGERYHIKLTFEI